MRLKNKTAIVTGAGRGIGRGICLELAKEGANIVAAARTVSEINQTKTLVKKMRGKTIAVACDVSKSDDVDNLVMAAIKEFGNVDILVNNAGVYIEKPIIKLNEEEWDEIININLKGVFLCTQQVVRHMLKKRISGRIISVSSVSGLVGYNNASAYCASKGGIIALTKELAVELAPYNITVDAIAPGVIKTSMNKERLAHEKTRKYCMKESLFKRYGKPKDIGHAVVYLASGNFVTGDILVVDGGWLAH